MKASREVILAWCGTVVCAWLESPLEAVADGLVGLGLKATYQGVMNACSTSREVPVRMTKGHQWQKHINRGMPSRIPCQVVHTTLRMEQLDVGDAGPILHEVEPG
jgi:hypothetical protein